MSPKKPKGFTLIELMVVIAILAIIEAIAIPNLSEARRSANDAAAISSLRTISTAQAMFREDDRGGAVTVLDYASNLHDLGISELIDDVLATGRKQGYCFVLVSYAPLETWHAHADPAIRGETGNRSFYIDETRVIRYDYGEIADASSLPLGDLDVPPGTPDERASETRIGCGSGRHLGNTNPSKPAFLAIQRLLKWMPDSARPMLTEFLAQKGLVGTVLNAMDTNNDGTLGFSEVSGLDSETVYREVRSSLSKNPPADQNLKRKIAGRESFLIRTLDWYFKLLRRALHLGIANETKFPTVPISEMLDEEVTLPANPFEPPKHPGNLPLLETN